jgi:uncharacterized membrane protein
MPHDWSFWLTTAIVAVLALLFMGYFITYLTLQQVTYMTHAEDLGTMDQAVWSITQGFIPHQTICNIISDTNCAGPQGIVRFSIHFEPILFVVALFYLVAPSPITLIVIQTVIVALGAFPAFWLARLRLRNNWAGVAIALLYLFFPAQQLATSDVFHAVTFTTAFVLFLFYFLYMQRTGWVFFFAVLAMACKEEIPGIVALCGLWTIIFQQRWRTGLGLLALALIWVGSALLVMKHFSPTGSPMLASRYSDLGNSPVMVAETIILHPLMIVKEYILEHNHFFYIRSLFAPTGYIALLAPWIVVLATPTLAINLFSSDPSMYSGLYQYNSEIVPILVIATVEAIALILFVLRWLFTRLESRRTRAIAVDADDVNIVGIPKRSLPFRSRGLRVVYAGVLALLLCGVVFSDVRADVPRGQLPLTQGFIWPQVTTHTALAQKFVDMIPANASVSAQSNLVPHISHRSNIYLFPYQDMTSDYVFLDVTSEFYPYFGSFAYTTEVKKLLLSGDYGVLAADDGYLLLQKGLKAPTISPYSAAQPGSDVDPATVLPTLPSNFCSFIQTSPQSIQNPVQVDFSSTKQANASLNLVGYSVGGPSTMSIGSAYISVTTDWRVQTPPTTPMQLVLFMTDSAGKEHYVSSAFSPAFWCQTNQWKSGEVMQLKSDVFGLQNLGLQPGPVHLSLALIPVTQSQNNLMDVQARAHVQVVQGTNVVQATSNATAVQLANVNLVP